MLQLASHNVCGDDNYSIPDVEDDEYRGDYCASKVCFASEAKFIGLGQQWITSDGKL